MGTGSEVQIAVAARERLEADGVPTRVVSVPCFEWFADQDQAYKDEVLPPSVRARVSVEAGVPMGWREFVGDAGRIVGLDPLRRQRRLLRALREVRPHRRGGRGRRPREHRGGGVRQRRPGRPGCRRPAASPTPPATAEPTAAADSTRHREGHRHGTEREAGRAVRAPGSPSGSTTSPATASAAGTCSRWSTSTRVVGATTNPTIFAAAISGSDSYDDQVHALAIRKVDVAGGAAHHHRRRRPGRLRPVPPGRRPAARRRAGLPRGGTRAWRTTPTRRTPRRRTSGGWSTGPTSTSRSRRPRPACRRSPRPSPRASASTSR